MKKLESQKQLFEDVFAVEHIHSSKKKLVIRTDVFEDGIIVQKVSANEAISAVIERERLQLNLYKPS